MSASFEISASTGAYKVRVERGALGEFFAPSKDRIIICDAFFAERFQKAGVDHIALEAEERQKSLEAMTKRRQEQQNLSAAFRWRS